MRKLTRCLAGWLILPGFSMAILFGYFFWKHDLPVNYWKAVKGKAGDCARYESFHLSSENSSCWEIIRGDYEAIAKSLLKSIEIANKYKAFTEIDYLMKARDCDKFVKNRKYITIPLSAEERDFPLAYSMVIHGNIEMFERLLRSIYAPQNVYCVHVDRKSPKPFHSAVEAIASCFNNVFIAGKSESVIYASWSRVQADLNCMEELLQSPVPWRYLINVCGQDLPTRTNREIVKSLMAQNDTNVIESDIPPTYKKKRWKFHYDVHENMALTNKQKEPPPIRSSMFVGSAYVLVTREFVHHLFATVEIQAFFKWSQDTYSPDEHIWATLQRMPGVPGSIPHVPGHLRIIARVVKWSFEAGDVAKGALYPPCTGKYHHLICTYGTGDLHWIVQREPWFANKFDPEVDNMAVQCMEEYLRHRAIRGACHRG
ncbi:beta-1,3-galactosyl-O-glycosyl-glycoprotein beta-1,6-N-acetylglucosaminyltransferase 3-like [Scyliorhinus canicula]|uniref:beta-1,3-galactosyl-O-glycosyl-glycoprotein beta-1,6-N-acetylglucosaminyltransferase 3-like n=1 Tax=Scyliorhinus canicula TaxID=7830 RepID=UPI0018F3A95F|nr:beta-1,3-galactosyl-O-glycosyl-glycoprotein beta-1,6-N-acetylglucosaminyltransferase 3-like [Scyliorhinus canicula]